MKILYILTILLSQCLFCQNIKCKKDKQIENILNKLEDFKEVYTSHASPFLDLEEPFREDKPFFSNEESDDLNFSLRDEKTNKTIYKSKKQRTRSINVNFCSLKIDKTKITIEGVLKGDYDGAGNGMFAFIGTIKDTVRNITIGPTPHAKKVFHNGKEVTEPITIASFPAITFEEYTGKKTEYLNNNLRTGYFKIQADINESSKLILALDGAYAKIYNIGKLIE